LQAELCGSEQSFCALRGARAGTDHRLQVIDLRRLVLNEGGCFCPGSAVHVSALRKSLMPGMTLGAQLLLADVAPALLAGVASVLVEAFDDLLFPASGAPAPTAHHRIDHGHVEWIHGLSLGLPSSAVRSMLLTGQGRTSDRDSSAAAASWRTSSSLPSRAAITASLSSFTPIRRGTRTNPAPS